MYGDRLVPVSYSRLGAKHRLQSWVHVLALAAAEPDREWSAHTIGRPESSRSRLDVATSVLTPDAEAVRALRGLVELRDFGLVEPLPVPLKARWPMPAHGSIASRRGSRSKRALLAWESSRFPGEDAEPAHVRVWGDRRRRCRAGSRPERRDQPRGDDPVRRAGRPALVAAAAHEEGSW